MQAGGGVPVMVLNQNMKRETGRKVQLQNVAAGKVRLGRARMTCAAKRSVQTAVGRLACAAAPTPVNAAHDALPPQAVADIIRTTLGPRSMLKMLLDPMGGIVITNDGNAILREIDVTHPAAKSMLELSRSQDEEVGDGTTSVIILGEPARTRASGSSAPFASLAEARWPSVQAPLVRAARGSAGGA